MIKGIWKNTEWLCGCHDKPVRMEIRRSQGRDEFYACPKYFLQDEFFYPNGHSRDEPMCTNRISFAYTEKIMDQYAEAAEEAMKNGGASSLVGRKFKAGGIEAVLIRDDPADFYNDGCRQFKVINTLRNVGR